MVQGEECSTAVVGVISKEVELPQVVTITIIKRLIQRIKVAIDILRQVDLDQGLDPGLDPGPGQDPGPGLDPEVTAEVYLQHVKVAVLSQ